MDGCTEQGYRRKQSKRECAVCHHCSCWPTRFVDCFKRLREDYCRLEEDGIAMSYVPPMSARVCRVSSARGGQKKNSVRQGRPRLRGPSVLHPSTTAGAREERRRRRYARRSRCTCPIEMEGGQVGSSHSRSPAWPDTVNNNKQREHLLEGASF